MKAIDTGLLQFYDPNTGKPVANGYVATYDTISTSPKETFADINGEVTNPNPVPLDSTGSAYIFGEGSYTFVIKNSAGVNVRTIENIGVLAGGAYEVDGDTPTINIGGGNNGYDSDDLLAIYSQSEPHELLGFGDISELVLQANVDNNNVAGDYETVSSVYTSSSSAVPAGTLIFDGPQDGYDPVSTRLYEFKSDGNFSVDPQSDTSVDDSGVGNNYIDVFRKAVTEEMRIKRTPMYWDTCKNLIGLQTIEYPIIVIGSDSRFYTTSGTPTAEQMADTDPVTDTGATVWTYVYDPTETAQYPPAYRSPTQRILYDDTDSIHIPEQSCKLKELSGSDYIYSNDGKTTTSKYKSSKKFVFGDGSAGSPVGGYASNADYGGTADWLDVWMMKTTGGDVDVCLYMKGQTVDAVAGALNLVTAEIAAGREWKYGRRIATVYVAGVNTFREFNYSGNGIYNHVNECSLGTAASATLSTTQFCPAVGAGFFFGTCYPTTEDETIRISLGETNSTPATYAYAKFGSSFWDGMKYTSTVRLRPSSAGYISFLKVGANIYGNIEAFCIGWQDLYED